MTCGLAVLLLAGAALTDPALDAAAPVRIEIEGVTAFTDGELREALAARLPTPPPHGILRVVERADGSLELTWESRRRVVDLGGDRGTTAARVAALLAADLVLPLGLPLPNPVPPQAMPASTAPPRDPAPRLHLGLGYEAWSGAPAGPLLHGPRLAAGLDRPYLRLRASAGYLKGTGNELIDVTAWPLRLSAGAGRSFGALLGNVVMIPYHLDGVVHVARALIGVGLEARIRLALGAGFAVEVDAGGEVYLNRRAEIWSGARQLFAMPAAAYRVGLGLSWGRPR